MEEIVDINIFEMKNNEMIKINIFSSDEVFFTKK